MSTRFDETADELDKFMDWTPQELADFLESAGLGDYRECVLRHKISGRLLHFLTDQDLKEMGIVIVGDRLRVKALIDTLGRKHRYNKRTKIWWEGEEKLYWMSAEMACITCCGICPDDPSTYQLTSNHLKIKTVNPMRLGPLKLPCCFEYDINNIDLTEISDVDIVGEPAPCCYKTLCCADGRGHVELSTRSSGRFRLTLTGQEADKASAMIMQNIEECQRMERE